ncbi:MAG TPA: UDP-3-O-[3-hydroxymyristoyl] N-acetylglucosamine deacetylase [Planctomycetaceae bacterium]|nr:UDP-3-O-[3-hydroxymyristoyl] N-acetylglucosamine deacetylase [Planctomycetaceae bacterium]
MLSDREVMPASRQQTTLQGPCTITGRGYWSGLVNTLTFLPAPAGTGIRFFRQDLYDEQGIEAVAENCQGLSLRTCLGSGQMRFEMIEHVMAALSGLQVDNALVRCTAAEMPGLDGSSYPLALALSTVGTIALQALRPQLRLKQPLRVGTDMAWVMIQPAERFEIEYQLDYGPNSPVLACEYSATIQPETFLTELSPARTFITRSDADALRLQGVATHVTDRDLIVFDAQGPIDNSLRFPNETARHKALDVLGDLAVVGADLLGSVTAYRSGHQLNGQLAARLRELLLNRSDTEGQIFDIQGQRRAA